MKSHLDHNPHPKFAPHTYHACETFRQNRAARASALRVNTTSNFDSWGAHSRTRMRHLSKEKRYCSQSVSHHKLQSSDRVISLAYSSMYVRPLKRLTKSLTSVQGDGPDMPNHVCTVCRTGRLDCTYFNVRLVQGLRVIC